MDLDGRGASASSCAWPSGAPSFSSPAAPSFLREFTSGGGDAERAGGGWGGPLWGAAGDHAPRSARARPPSLRAPASGDCLHAGPSNASRCPPCAFAPPDEGIPFTRNRSSLLPGAQRAVAPPRAPSAPEGGARAVTAGTRRDRHEGHDRSKGSYGERSAS
jgi:hypothetical protein